MRLRHLLTIVILLSLALPDGHARAVAAGLPPAAPPSSGALSVVAGYDFTCVVTTGGGAQCWGKNWSGKLGDGTDVDRSAPADVSGLTSGVAAVAAGNDSLHVCALTTGGAVKCWGWNANGDLGDGTTTARSTPVSVVGLSGGVVSISVGTSHSCAVLVGGAVKCWGWNAYGQLGDGTTVDRSTPVSVVGLPGPVTAVAAGVWHSCAVLATGGAVCWGSNSTGQLGDGTTVDRLTPTPVSGLASGVVNVSIGGCAYTCAVLASGEAKCWGLNSSGQLGNGTTVTSVTPVNVVGLGSGVSSISTGNQHACAVTAEAGVKCWGANNAGELGDGTTTPRLTPTNVQNLAAAVSAVSAGMSHTCALATDGGVQCWGSDSYGMLGVGIDLRRLTPIDAVGLGSGVSAVSAGYVHTCTRMSDGSARCWGGNGYGQLGDGTTTSRATPAGVIGLLGSVTAVAEGVGHTCALTDSGGVTCWGGNSDGQLGDGTTTQRTWPAYVSGLTSGVLSVAAGWDHSCVVTSAGGVKCWGRNSSGELGDGTTTQRATPVDVTGLSNGVVKVAVGSSYTCALTAGGGVVCWGFNANGELGDGTTTTRSTPAYVSGLTSGVTAVATGSVHACALMSGGAVKCWGYNGWGQLGDGTVTRRLTPVNIVGMTGVTALAAGCWHTCAVTGSGGTKCWGQNSNGQIGDGTMTSRLVPTDVAGLTSASAVTAGMYHSCALTTGGGVKCWGDDTSGQLGDGRTMMRSWPVNALGFGATITLTNLTQIYDGTPKPVTVATAPPGLSVTVTYTGIGTTTYGPSQSAPSGLGTYAALANVTDAGYGGSGSATATLTIRSQAPAVNAVIPSFGPVSGGTPITITGTNFGAGATVLVGGIDAMSVVVVNATTITAVTPAHGAGVVNIVVTNDGGQAATLEGGFTYFAGTGAAAITVGQVHTCALTAGGAVTCWGGNSYGQLGDGTTTTRVTPTAVSGLVIGVATIAAGDRHTCAATAAGGAACWGDNGYGQLGDGTTTARMTPTAVSGLGSGVAASAAGFNHSCALVSGGVVCWGYNGAGQLGDGTWTNRSTPTAARNLGNGITAITAGAVHSCALTSGGGVVCWGGNYDGQLGDGTTTTRSISAGVTGLGSGVAAVTAGYWHTCALTAAGAVMCWGENGDGQLGDGTTTARSTPTMVSGLGSGVVAVAAGALHTCAVRASGGVVCWGDNDYGQLGDGTLTQRETPTAVDGLSSGMAAVSAGYYHSCALTAGGGAVCWGRNWLGQLGDGTTQYRLTPVAVIGFEGGTAAPTVTAVWPVTGPPTGGTAVTITGTGFRAGAAVTFGGTAATSVVVANATTITAVTPAHGAGVVDVVVTNDDAQAGALAGAFTYADVALGATVAAGASHTCALTAGGGVTCWGANTYGQVGDGTTTTRPTPTPVSGLAAGVEAVEGGGYHTCALTAAGAVVCWGYNYYGQIGDGTTTNRLTPAGVSGLSGGVTAIAAGRFHTCALTTAGSVLCWGYNSTGQVGDGTTTDRWTPTPVSGLGSGIVAITAGGTHTCALTTSGAVLCWGANDSGQLGDGTSLQRLTPTSVTGLGSGVAILAAGGGYSGSHTCALTIGGSVLCWGANGSGQLGDGTMTPRLTPVSVSGLGAGVSAISAGGSHTCALRTTGTVQCWGANESGQLGDGTTTQRLMPTAVSGLSGGATWISAGYDHACAMVSGGDVVCWGADVSGQLGDGSPTSRMTPASVTGLSINTAAIAAGAYHTCALTGDGGALCWGDNGHAQLGDGTLTDRLVATGVTGLSSGVAAITAGYDHSCALTTGGGVFCWGANWYGELGEGTTAWSRTTPTAVSGLGSGVAAIAARGYHTCALTTGGSILCWGYNGMGQLGDGTASNRSTPTMVSGLSSGAVGIAAGEFHTCALKAAGGVVCWGYNGFGQLGDGTTTNRSTPTPVSGLGGAGLALAAGLYHTCALTTAGGVVCWGSNSYGQLGDGTATQRLSPTPVSGLSAGVAAIAADRYHTCAMKTDGGVVCWGSNQFGQLGDGTRTDRLVPTAVQGLESGISAIAVGQYHSCAVAAGGALVCWGNDGDGQLGVGRRMFATAPLGVYGLGGAIAASAISPPAGPTGGGTQVTISGAYFLQGATVTIGGVPATGVRVVNPETITATTAAHAAGAVGVLVINPDGTQAAVAGGFKYAATSAVRSDFTGDLKSDILWRHAAQGDVWLWPMDGPARTAESYVRTVSDPNWEIRAIADFDGDGQADLFWRNTVSGQLYYWPMDGATALDEVYAGTVDPAYDIVGSGDFNADGQADLLWRHTTLGDVWVWLMDGATPLSQVYIDTVDPGYVVKGVGDLDANGKADIVWHGAAGDVWVWPMDGTTRLDQVWVGTVPDTEYQIEGVADVTGDRKADLVWWHVTRGEVWLWTMNGPVRQAEDWVATVADTTYQIAGTGDYNGDGKAALLWQNAVNGEVWVWLMNGPVRVSETWIATVPDAGYRIIR